MCMVFLTASFPPGTAKKRLDLNSLGATSYRRGHQAAEREKVEVKAGKQLEWVQLQMSEWIRPLKRAPKSSRQEIGQQWRQDCCGEGQDIQWGRLVW
jgi:hypothetical protein